MNLDELATELHAFEAVDKSPFQRRARILQSIWRKEHDYPCGDHGLGSRLPMPWAQQSLKNFITERTREVVRMEVLDPKRSAGKLYGKPRIFNNLLSSQPLCFNLFSELRRDLPLASSMVADLTQGRFREVQWIDFEYSPGRRDPRYTGDRSAFDVFLTCLTRNNQRGFIGIEVKYHEDLRNPAEDHTARYDEIAQRLGCFAAAAAAALKAAPLQQIWRDHLLAGITRDVDRYQDALFVLLYPAENLAVKEAVRDYRAFLTNEDTFDAWTIEDVVGRIKAKTPADWIDDFRDRYLAFEKIDQRLNGIP